MILRLALPALLLAAPALAADSRPVDCTIEVDGTVHERGICEFEPRGGDGGFQLSGARYFVQVEVVAKDRAEAFWNADPLAMHAQTPLGEVARAGACWTSARARICAKTLPRAETAAILAARPKGAYLVPDLPGAAQSCLRVEPTPPSGATLALDACRSPLAKLFARGAGGDGEAEAAAAGKAERTPDGDAALRIALDPPLCLDLAEAERPDRRTVLLAPCTAASPTWTTEAAPAASAPVATSDGWCLTIPAAETPDARFPFPVAAVRCEGGEPPPVAFFLTDG